MTGGYFLTGGTGFVGQELLRHLAATSMTRTYCLVREHEGRSAEQRLKRALAKVGVRDDERFVAVAGDVAQPELGISPERRASLARDVRTVIHAAADVRFNQSLESVSAVNVAGTRAMLELAQECRRENPDFSHFAYVSTAFVAGRRTGVLDAETWGHGCGFKNTYEQSKHEAEGLVREASRELPTVIFRPSIVLGAADGSGAKRRDLLYPLVMAFAHWPFPVIGQDAHVRVDFVPVDFVARAILYLGEATENHGRAFHLAAGPGEDLSMTECTQIVAKAMSRRVVAVPNRIWQRLFVPLLARLDSELMERGAELANFFGPYLDQENPRFSMAATDLALSGSGIQRPPLEQALTASVRRTLAAGGAALPAPLKERARLALSYKTRQLSQWSLRRVAHGQRAS